MKNPYASTPPPDSALQQKSRKLAAWHEQEAMACEHAASLSRDGAWRNLDQANPPPPRGGFSAQG